MTLDLVYVIPVLLVTAAIVLAYALGVEVGRSRK